ncbi:MAG: hypothetical protein LBP83_09620, partial [Dysgonamonadaceae bacterium]|nr:hypothetical protein [Dysgonamonadaceae bacterium]
MNKSILFSIFCAFCVLTGAAQSYSGGSGTEADPYRISSKADMEALATAVNSNTAYSISKYFLLTQDITDEVTTIVGNSSYPFYGTFDGGGHSITVNINTTTTYAGVFGYIYSATVKNLGVTGSISSSSSYYSSSYSGGICGYASSSSISNCYNTGSISSSSS